MSRVPAPETRRCPDLTSLGVITGLPTLAGVSGLTCRLRVLLSGASIDGSLWYGDLPAPDGARDDRHSRAFSWRARRRPQHLKEPRLLERCCTRLMSVVPVADRVALSLIPSSTPVSHPSPCVGLSRTGSTAWSGWSGATPCATFRLDPTHRAADCGRSCPAGRHARSPRLTRVYARACGCGLAGSTRSAVAIGLRRDAAVSAMSPPRGDSSPGCRRRCSGTHRAQVDGLLLRRSAASAPAR